MTAIRETFEETGLLLASATTSVSELPQSPTPPPPPSLSEAALDASRESIHTGKSLFRDFLKQHALSADVKALLPFTEWITPLGNSRCVHACGGVEALPFSHTHTKQTTTCYYCYYYTQGQPLPHAFLRRFPALSPHVC